MVQIQADDIKRAFAGNATGSVRHTPTASPLEADAMPAPHGPRTFRRAHRPAPRRPSGRSRRAYPGAGGASNCRKMRCVVLRVLHRRPGARPIPQPRQAVGAEAAALIYSRLSRRASCSLARDGTGQPAPRPLHPMKRVRAPSRARPQVRFSQACPAPERSKTPSRPKRPSVTWRRNTRWSTGSSVPTARRTFPRVKVYRLLRTRVNFTSTLRVLVCSSCQRALSAELAGFA